MFVVVQVQVNVVAASNAVGVVVHFAAEVYVVAVRVAV